MQLTGEPDLDDEARARCGLAADRLIDDEMNLATPTGEEIMEGLSDPPVRVRRAAIGGRWTLRSIQDLADRSEVGRDEKRLLKGVADGTELRFTTAWRLQQDQRRLLVVYQRESLGVPQDGFYAPPDVVGDLDGDGNDELVFTASVGSISPTVIAFSRPPKRRVTEIVRDWPATRIDSEEESLRVAVAAPDCTGDGRRDALMLFSYDHCKDTFSLDKCEVDREWRVYAFSVARAPPAGRLERSQLLDDPRMHLVAPRGRGEGR